MLQGYLEELLRVRDGQVREMQAERRRLVESLQHHEAESQKDRQQLEAVIIELQAQL